MTAQTLITERTRMARDIAIAAIACIAVVGGIGAAAVKADEHYRAEALINQENLTWKQ